ncbi:MAG: hypothetical protein ACI3XI_04575 [Eubacteriales bacterium]
MKKIISISLALIMLICVVGCDTGTTKEIKYNFVSKGTVVGIGEDAKVVASKLGEAQKVIESPTCGGGEEPDREYQYAGFKFNSVNENGVNRIVKVVFTDDSVTTPEGIMLGSTRDAVITAYGEGYTETSGGIVYTDGKTKLMFGITNGSVSTIQYIEA